MIHYIIVRLILVGISFLIINVSAIIALKILNLLYYSSRVDQDPDDQFEVREEWKDFM